MTTERVPALHVLNSIPANQIARMERLRNHNTTCPLRIRLKQEALWLMFLILCAAGALIAGKVGW